MSKYVETATALLAILLVSLMIVLAAQTEGAQQWKKRVVGVFFEDLDDIAPGPAVPSPSGEGMATWISSDDYPAEALRNQWEGTSAIVWTVDKRGRITDCHTANSSGHRVLDEAACNAITLRGRFTPARDASGHRTEYSMHRRIVWRLPD
ncbi:energy transducer TonB [Sphingobium phenoxybenzoativorans]|uniref:energy transducer TonB n=1 Tax=Sphingobium phenoxybenzoativorans TaxID=1592790 RepID=UPI001495F1C4|nr:energy transducer TonB [Sphingobium phenoxybenzoativorans]